MRSSIIDKLWKHLSDGISREADVVYLFIEVGKYLEQETASGYPLLRFYRNWAAHSWIGNLKLAGDIPTELNNAVASFLLTQGEEPTVGWINRAISMKRLRSELFEFLKETKLPTGIVENEEEWRKFLRLLIGVLADVPLVFEGFDHIKTFRFTEVELKGNVKEKLATWVIEAPGYVFQGDVFSS